MSSVRPKDVSATAAPDACVERCLAGVAPKGVVAPSQPAPWVAAAAQDTVARARFADAVESAPKAAPLVTRLAARAELTAKQALARWIYRPAVLTGHRGLLFLGKVTKQKTELDRKWLALEALHASGHFGIGYGERVGDGATEVMSKVIATRTGVQKLASQTRTIGRDLMLPDGTVVPVKKAEVGLMLHVSGMSYPQLSAPSIMSLVYANARMAKDGVRYLLNTGEGGPNLHLAFLTGDAEALRKEVIAWGQRTGEIPPGGVTHARVEELIRRLMKERNELFKDLTPEDLGKAQIVAQFGTALNGIRAPDGGIDFAKLEEIGKHPNVAMVEFKLKQAAKRGSLVAMSKMDHIAASIRRVSAGAKFKSPAVTDAFATYENIASLVTATKLATGKPVSLKFAVGDVENIYEFLEYLAHVGALPDSIQIDGAGKELSPGSGNSPQTGAAGNSSLMARNAVLVVDTILKHLGVRDEMHLSVAGEVMMPTDGLEMMALGADGIFGARTWLGMGLGCAGTQQCNNGTCPFGIASKGDSIFTHSLDARVVAPKAYAAATEWRDNFLVSMLETGAMDWRSFRKTHGLHARQTRLRVRDDQEQVSIQKHYGPERLADLVGEVLTPAQAQAAVYGYRPREYAAYELFDATRRTVKYLGEMLTKDPAKADAVAAFVARRVQELEGFLAVERSGPDIIAFIRAGIPAELAAHGMRRLASDQESQRWSHPQLEVRRLSGGDAID